MVRFCSVWDGRVILACPSKACSVAVIELYVSQCQAPDVSEVYWSKKEILQTDLGTVSQPRQGWGEDYI